MSRTWVGQSSRQIGKNSCQYEHNNTHGEFDPYRRTKFPVLPSSPEEAGKCEDEHDDEQGNFGKQHLSINGGEQRAQRWGEDFDAVEAAPEQKKDAYRTGQRESLNRRPVELLALCGISLSSAVGWEQESQGKQAAQPQRRGSQMHEVIADGEALNFRSSGMSHKGLGSKHGKDRPDCHSCKDGLLALTPPRNECIG
ncbi:hypothetical protein D3C72_828160 [compost metagenome]